MDKITPEYLETLIESETYSNTGKTTVCILKLRSGFEVVGASGIVDVSQFNEALGNKYARETALNALRELEGYRSQWNSWVRGKATERPLITIEGDMQAVDLDVFDNVKKAAISLDNAGFEVHVSNFYINGKGEMPIDLIDDLQKIKR